MTFPVYPFKVSQRSAVVHLPNRQNQVLVYMRFNRLGQPTTHSPHHMGIADDVLSVWPAVRNSANNRLCAVAQDN